MKDISIHALREEGDWRGNKLAVLLRTISIHALREEGDFVPKLTLLIGLYFYPRPPRGGRLWAQDAANRLLAISIHALREEGECGFPDVK